MFLSKNKHDIQAEQESYTAEFLSSRYLSEEYIVPGFIQENLTTAAAILTDTVPGFKAVVNVGGTANGSYELRRKTNPRAPTDLDFYTIGDNQTLPYLEAISDTIQGSIQPDGILLDGVLNGKNPDNFLNLDRLEQIAQRGDTYLLSLPFQSAFGDSLTAKAKVLEFVVTQPNKQEVWDEIASYHLQSLSLHHGSWPQTFSDTILNDFYPKKIDTFELPETPEEYLATMSEEK